MVTESSMMQSAGSRDPPGPRYALADRVFYQTEDEACSLNKMAKSKWAANG